MKKRYEFDLFCRGALEYVTIFDNFNNTYVSGLEILNLLNKYYNTIHELKVQNRQLNDIVMKLKK